MMLASRPAFRDCQRLTVESQRPLYPSRRSESCCAYSEDKLRQGYEGSPRPNHLPNQKGNKSKERHSSLTAVLSWSSCTRFRFKEELRRRSAGAGAAAAVSELLGECILLVVSEDFIAVVMVG